MVVVEGERSPRHPLAPCAATAALAGGRRMFSMASFGRRWCCGFRCDISGCHPPPVISSRAVLAVGSGAAFASIAAALAQARAGRYGRGAGGENTASRCGLKSGVTLRGKVPRRHFAGPAHGDGTAGVWPRASRRAPEGFSIRGGPGTPLPAGIVLTDSEVKLEDTSGRRGDGYRDPRKPPARYCAPIPFTIAPPPGSDLGPFGALAVAQDTAGATGTGLAARRRPARADRQHFSTKTSRWVCRRKCRRTITKLNFFMRAKPPARAGQE